MTFLSPLQPHTSRAGGISLPELGKTTREGDCSCSPQGDEQRQEAECPQGAAPRLPENISSSQEVCNTTLEELGKHKIPLLHTIFELLSFFEKFL